MLLDPVVVYFSWQDWSDSYTLLICLGIFKMFIPFLPTLHVCLGNPLNGMLVIRLLLRFSAAFVHVIGLPQFWWSISLQSLYWRVKPIYLTPLLQSPDPLLLESPVHKEHSVWYVVAFLFAFLVPSRLSTSRRLSRTSQCVPWCTMYLILHYLIDAYDLRIVNYNHQSLTWKCFRLITKFYWGKNFTLFLEGSNRFFTAPSSVRYELIIARL